MYQWKTNCPQCGRTVTGPFHLTCPTCGNIWVNRDWVSHEEKDNGKQTAKKAKEDERKKKAK